MVSSYDVVVIGGGVAGYSTSIRLARHGLRVLLVEERLIGGECVNYGCVPTKALHAVARSLRQLKIAGLELSYRGNPMVFARGIAERVREGIEYLLRRYGVDVVRGRAQIVRDDLVRVSMGSDVAEYGCRYIVVASGTDPRTVPPLEIDEKHVLSNRGFVELEELPSSILIVGGGPVGVELASILANLGTEVHLVEVMPEILPGMDRDVARALRRFLKLSGVDIRTNTTVIGIEKGSGWVEARLSDGSRLRIEKILVAVGRTPRTHGVGLENVGIELDGKRFVVVDELQRTSNPRILAVGDVAGPPLLAHKALLESRIAVDTILGRTPSYVLRRELVPVAIFTVPEVGCVGLSEEDARRKGYRVRSVKIPVTVSAKSFIEACEGGFIKVVLDERNNVLGLHVVAPNASEIASLGLELIERKLDLETVAYRPYPHLTASEVLKELIETVLGEPLHVYIKS